jgi:hypothetical protein
VRKIDALRYDFLLMLYHDGMLTPKMEEELDHLEAMITGAESCAEAAREENKLNER